MQCHSQSNQQPLTFEQDLYRFNLRTHRAFSWLQYESGYSHSLTDCDHGNLSAIIHKSKARNIQSCETSHCSQTQKNLLCVWYYLQECGFVDSKPYKWLLCPSYCFKPTFMYLCKCFCEDVGTYQLITPHFSVAVIHHAQSIANTTMANFLLFSLLL